MIKKFQHGILYVDPELFFELDGNASMKLTPDAAQAVCRLAANKGFYVGRVEGGFFSAPSFEHRLDCIWDSIPDAPMSKNEAEVSNVLASEFIAEQSRLHNAFIITAMFYN